MWQKILDVYYAVTAPAVTLLEKTGVRPVHVTLAGLLISVLAGIAYAAGGIMPAFTLFVAAGICDTFDGQLARRTGSDGPWGAFLDSTTDRIAETAVHMGIAWYFLPEHPVPAMLSFGALAAAYMVSYTRARAEGVGVPCKTGLMQRPHRFLVLAFGTLAGYNGIVAALAVIFVLSAYTAWQRIMTVRKGVS